MSDAERKLAADKKRLRISVHGAAAVGKTAIIRKLLEKTFSPIHEPTVDHIYHTTFDIGRLRNSQLQIHDNSGTYHFPAMRRLAIEKSDGIVLVYSTDRDGSFSFLELVRDEIRNDFINKGSKVPVVVVRNKIDKDYLPLPMEYALQKNIITQDWNFSFIETSAKDDINISATFIKILRSTYSDPELISKDSDITINIAKSVEGKHISLPEGFDLFKRRCTLFVKSFSSEKSEES